VELLSFVGNNMPHIQVLKEEQRSRVSGIIKLQRDKEYQTISYIICISRLGFFFGWGGVRIEEEGASRNVQANRL
jgi:hypothetical protein